LVLLGAGGAVVTIPTTVMGQQSSVIHDLWFIVGLVLLGAGGAAVTIPTAALILGKAAIIGAGQDHSLLDTFFLYNTGWMTRRRSKNRKKK
jgi:hypothetical protein